MTPCWCFGIRVAPPWLGLPRTVTACFDAPQLDYDNSELSDRGLWVSGTDSPRASVDTSDRDDEMTLLHDGLFWFSNPALMLSVVHATMFQARVVWSPPDHDLAPVLELLLAFP